MTTAIFTPCDAKMYGTQTSYPAIVSAVYEVPSSPVEEGEKVKTIEVADIHVFGNDPSMKWPKLLVAVPTAKSESDYCTIETTAKASSK